MSLNADTLNWAIDFLCTHSDGDLFPKILELEALSASRALFAAQIEGKDLRSIPVGGCRRFIVPKDDVSYRQATQLDPQDSIILSAIVYQYGQGIEKRRASKKQVFSYRFLPTSEDGLYGGQTAWNDFWAAAASKAHKCSHILYCDIADFYNQIYHHTVENQLAESGFPNQEIQWILNLLKSTTSGVSRGVPIGPHAIHLIAEATLIPIDNSLNSYSIDFLRYADDILVFCKSERAARTAIAQIASTLDRQQRLILQRHKTKIYCSRDFENLCAEMVEDKPINKDEAELLKLIKKYSGGNPYKMVSYNQISEADWMGISSQTIQSIINEYISSTPIDYVRLRWFYRRLSQIGHPGAVEISITNLEKLGPCFSNICFYLSSIQSIPPKEWRKIGTKLLRLLSVVEVQSNEFFKLSILSLFTRVQGLNHIKKLLQLFVGSDPYVKREIILAAKTNRAVDWMRELKETYPSMDQWQKNAYLYAISDLPRDERKYLLNLWPEERPFQKALSKWVKG